MYRGRGELEKKLMTVTEFITFFDLENRATSNGKIKILNNLGIITERYKRDSQFTTEVLIIKLQPTESGRWVLSPKITIFIPMISSTEVIFRFDH